MASGKPNVSKQKRHPKEGSRKPSTSKNPNKIPLGPNRAKTKKKKNEKDHPKGSKIGKQQKIAASANLPASQQLSFFLQCYQSSNDIKLSSLELESFKDTCIVEAPKGLEQDSDSLFKHMKAAFGTSWEEVLCEEPLCDGNINPGSPAVLVISTSALRSLELLRGLRPLTKECRPAKLFAKHMKVEDQVTMLKSRVNIASGTPSRIKKLIDIDALGLSRLAVIVLDMHTDAKGYSLFTLPQVSDEFWDLYKSHFQQRLIQGDLRICLYGPISYDSEVKTSELEEE